MAAHHWHDVAWHQKHPFKATIQLGRSMLQHLILAFLAIKKLMPSQSEGFMSI